MCSDSTARLATALYVWSRIRLLLSAYPEGAFVALSALTVIFISKGRILSAAVTCGIATAFSPLGVCLAVAVIVGSWPKQRLWKTSLSAVISVSGILAWSAWLGIRYHNPFVFITEQSTFNRKTIFPFSSLFSVIAHPFGKAPPGNEQLNFDVVRLINASLK